MADSGSTPGRPPRNDGPDAHRGHDGHDTHDLELIAALLDRDLPAADRAVAEARVAACAACAALHTDLVALTQANLELAIPARPRDFSLAPGVVAGLLQGGPREPVPSGARLTGKMTDATTRHAMHDRLLIANLVDRTVSDAERARAGEQLAACRDCTQLYHDLVALSAATRALATPSRPRDFTLTLADAERLRVRGWRRVLAAIGSSRDVFSRPLAAGLTTLGLAGLLVATVPAALTGLASAPILSTAGQAVGDAAGSAATNPEILSGEGSEVPPARTESGPAAIAAAPSAAGSAAAEALPLPSDDSNVDRQEPDSLFVGGESSPLAGEPDDRDLYGASPAGDEPIAPSAVVIVAALLLLAGLGLFALRWTARRLGDG